MTSSSKSSALTLLFVPLDAVGHVNSCIGLAQIALKRHHRVVFAVPQTWKSKLVTYGFEEEGYVDPEKGGDGEPRQFTMFMKEYAHVLPYNSYDKLRQFEAPGWEPMGNEVKRSNTQIGEIIKRVKPDVIISDGFLTVPTVVAAGIPWVNLISCNQLYCSVDEKLPPGGSGESNKLKISCIRKYSIS